MSSSSWSAYSVMRKNHCSRSRSSTRVPQRPQRPSTTCSLASTVASFGHQLTARSYGRRAPARRAAGRTTGSSGSTTARRWRPRATSRWTMPHALNCSRNPRLRTRWTRAVPAGPDRGVLGREPERVVAHRMQDLVAVAAPEVRHRVAHRVRLQVSDVRRRPTGRGASRARRTSGVRRRCRWRPPRCARGPIAPATWARSGGARSGPSRPGRLPSVRERSRCRGLRGPPSRP